MTRRLILAGVPKIQAQRNPRYAPTFPGWEVVRCDSLERKQPIISDSVWRLVLDAASESGHDGAHIFAFHLIRDDRPRFEADIRGRFRLRWLDLALVHQFGRDTFTDCLRRSISIEETWCRLVKPKNYSSPLLLPDCSFAPRRGFSEVWNVAQRAKDLTDCQRVAQLLKGFVVRHYNRPQSYWLDAANREYRRAKHFHGTHVPNSRLWRFGFRLPPGLHYDVTKDGGLTLRDCKGDSFTFAERANIDCHGYIRGFTVD